MPTPPKKSKTSIKILLGLVIVLILLSIGLAALHETPWKIPPEAKVRKNPLPANDANLNAAKPVYNEYCSNCHGDTGKGDGSDAMMYDPGPSNLTERMHMNSLTDGEIFYQITQGRKPMPSFRKKLTEDQRWQLVILVRSFAAPALPATLPRSQQTPPSLPQNISPKKTKGRSEDRPANLLSFTSRISFTSFTSFTSPLRAPPPLPSRPAPREYRNPSSTPRSRPYQQ